ncbi:Spo0E like sporulation regulatory protein [Thalassobacillus cyri]|uniref:Spo0E like sporulation regulatory protein n=1 Tax=Thalassobacillus cyri TaxID=571932 RepID=A0A1H3XN05_9BACI|nr:aspartyl-phosphate phosphatase Spo0E family protein [Thalassobacillus cyri]SDZ99962.1 Spo0E like sporulation regulatory protein [Thalassobacillus cyri]
MEKAELEQKIEEQRQKLYHLYITDDHYPEIVKISQYLDELLNEYTLYTNSFKQQKGLTFE